MDDDFGASSFWLAVTSWPAVYALICLPAVLMAANFVFGRCGVAEAIESREPQPNAVASVPPRRAVIRGRLSLVGVAVAFIWQLDVLLHILAEWSLPWSALCLTPSAVFALAYIPAVLCRPMARQPSNGHTVSRCRKCARDVVEMDHHCFWIHNCVGAHNRLSFVAAVCAACAAAVVDLFLGWPSFARAIEGWRFVLLRTTVTAWDYEDDRRALRELFFTAEVIAGWPVAAVACAGTAYLALNQLVLLARGETTLSRMKARRSQQRQS
jgi:hypothetical protein